MLNKKRSASSKFRSSTPQKNRSQKKRLRNRLLYEVLEERRVLDGAPVITVDSLVTNDARPKLTGTIEGVADSIEITVGGQSLPATQTGTTWELADNALTALLEGTYDVVASATNSSGTGTDETNNELTIDLTAPNAPTSLDLADASDSGSSSVDDITADATPLITGTAEAGSLVELFDTDGVTSLGTATVAGDGIWAISSSSLSDGAHTLSAVATDSAGNVSSSSAGLAISIDTTAPTVEVDVQFVNDNTPAVSGTVNENDAELVITVAGQTLAATNNANGTWTLADNSLSVIVDGTYNVWAVATDVAGNIGTDTNVDELTVDTVAPAIPSQPDLVFSSDTGVSTTDDITSDATPTFAGTGEPGSSVEIFDDATSLGVVVVDAGGAWEFTSSTLGDGTHELTAVATDASGNMSNPSPALTITVDTVAATVTVDALATNDSSPELTGLVDDDAASLRVTVAGQTYSASNNGDGTWTLANDVLAAITDATYNVSVTATDAAGNVGSDATASELEIDTTAPIVTVDELITNDTTPELTGTVDDATATISVTVAGQTHSATNNGDGTWVIADDVLSAIFEGAYDASVLATDLLSNVGTDFSVGELLVDVTPPAAPSLIDLVAASDTGFSEVDNVTSDNTPSLRGSAEAGSTVTLFSEGERFATTRANAVGDWVMSRLESFEYLFDFGPVGSPVLSDYIGVTPGTSYTEARGFGWESGTIKAVDRGVGDGLTRDINYTGYGTFVVDVPAGDYEVSFTVGDPSYGHEQMGFFLEGVQVALLSTGAGVSVVSSHEVTVSDGQLTILMDDLGGGDPNVVIQALEIFRVGQLSDGEQLVSAVATDIAGNVSSVSDSLPIVVDTTPPVLLFDLFETKDAAPQLSGWVDDETALLSLAVEGQSHQLINNSDGSWTLLDDALFTLREGVYDVTITAENIAGLTSIEVFSDSIVIDLTAPRVGVDKLITNDTTPRLSGVVDDAVASVVVTVNGETHDAINNGNGTWTLPDNTLAVMAEAVYDVEVSATDVAGNVGVDTTTNELVIDTTVPVLESITRRSPGGIVGPSGNQTVADALIFRVTFNEAMRPLVASDFSVTGTTANVSDILTVADEVFEITISGGDLDTVNDSTVGLDLAGGNGIKDLAGNDLPTVEPVTDETFFVDNNSPASIPLTDLGLGLPLVGNSTVSWADYDSDGDLDFLVAGELPEDELSITNLFTNNGDETFTAVAWDVPGIARGDSAWGDYDKDGDLDLLLTGYAGYSIYSAITRLYKNDGSGGFEDATVGLPGLVNGSLEWGDFDNDGDLDIALAGESDAGAITRIYRNDSGAFVDIQAGLPGVVNGDVAWGDRDNDGDLDLLVTGDTGGAGVATLFDNSNGTFTDANVGLPALTDSAAEWGDFDNDGDLDLVLAGLTASEEGLTEVFRNTGSGLVSIDAGFEGVSDGDVSWGDADNDGDLDLLITGRSYDLGDEDIRLYRNTSDGFSDVSAELPTLPTGDVAWGDYDADGDLDLLLSGGDYVSAFSGVYRNDVASVNTVPDVPFDMSEMYVTPTSYMLSWVAPTDAETPITGLSYNLRIGTAPGLSDIVRPMSFEPGSTTGAEGLQKVAQRGMVNGTNWTIAGLTSGDPYYWSVQAIDPVFGASEFSPEQFIDTTPPATVSFTKLSPAGELTNVNTLFFRAVFSEDVIGVTPDDFLVTGAAATVASVTMVDARTYDLRVTGGDLDEFDGDVGIDLAPGQNITDPTKNPLPLTEPTPDETYALDNTVPVLTVDALITNDTDPPVTGTVDDPSVQVSVLVNGVTYTAVLGGDGTWSLPDGTLPELAEGTYEVFAYATDATGNSGTDLTANELVIDTTAPTFLSINRQAPEAATTNEDVLIFRIAFDENVDSVTADDFVLTGTTGAITAVDSVDGRTFDLTVSGGDLPTMNGEVGLDLAGGQDIVDLAGNGLPDTQPAIDETYLLDNVAPEVVSFTRQSPVAAPTSVDSLLFEVVFSEEVFGVNADDFSVTGTTAVVTTVDVINPTTYRLFVTGGDLAGLDAVVGLNVAVGHDVVDAAGNALLQSEPSTDETYNVDNSVPVLTVDSLWTNDSTPALTGTVDGSGLSVAVMVAGQQVTATNVGGVWSVNDGALSALTDGTYDVLSAATDAAGNTGTDASLGELTVDTTAPAVAFTRSTPASSPTNADTLVFRLNFSEEVQNVNSADFVVSGTTATVTDLVLVDGVTYDVTVSGGNLAGLDGVVGLDFASTQDIVDLAGNALPSVGPATDQEYTVDNTIPALLSFERNTPDRPATNADVLVFRAVFSDDVVDVNDSDFAVTGTTARVSGVVAVDARTYDITVRGGDLDELEGTVGLDLSPLGNIADAAGNVLPKVEPATDETYLIDNTPPEPPASLDLTSASDTGISDTDDITGDNTPTIVGSAEPFVSVELFAGGVSVGTATADGSGVWSITATVLGDGEQTFAASAIDAAGNASATSSPLIVTIDTVAPVVTVNSLFTNDPTPPLSGEVNDPDAAVSIVVAGQTVSAANVGDGTWSLADNLLSVLDDGEYNVVASATDVAGNVGVDATINELVIDNTPPEVVVNIIAASLNDTGRVSLVTFEFTEAVLGFGEADVSVSGGVLTGFALIDADSFKATFTADEDLEAVGSVTVSTGYTDLAGNVGVGGSDTVAIDTKNPTVLVDIVDESLSDSDPDSIVTFTFSEVPVGFELADITAIKGTMSDLVMDAALTYHATFTADDDEEGVGSVTVSADKFTDAAGNDNLDATPDTVTIDRLNPTVVSVSASVGTVSDADVGSGTFALTVVFSEPMLVSGSADPVLGFPATGEDPTATITFVSGAWTNAETYVATYDVVDASESIDNIDVSVSGGQDLAGNVQDADVQGDVFSVDTENPAVAVDIVAASLSDSDLVSVVTFDFSEAVLGFAEADVSVSGGTLSGFASVGADSFTATFTADQDSEVVGSVSVAAGSYTDAVGNDGSGDSDTVTIDTKNPEATVELTAGSLSDGSNSTALTITFSESPFGFVPGDDLSVTGGVLGTGSFDTATLVWTATYTANDDFDGIGSVTLTAGSYADAAGNAGSGDSDSVTIDTKNPEATVELVATSLSDGTNSTDLTITFSESPVGFVPGDDLSVSGGVLGTGSFDADNLVWTATYTANDDFDGTGSVTLTAGSYADAVGNVGSGGADTVMIDTKNPEAIVVLVADNLSDGSNSTDLTITFSESPVGFVPGDDLSVSGGVLSTGSFDTDNLVWTATYTANDDFDGTGSVTLAAGSYADAAGNAGSGDSDSVTIDTENPEATVTLVADNLSDGTNSTDLTITFSESPVGFVPGDDLSVSGGVLGTGSFDTDNLVWTATYTANDDFDGTGSVTLTAGSYADAVGNVGSGGADTVTIDTENPEAIVALVADNLSDGTNSTDLTITFSESPVGFVPGDDLSVSGGVLGTGSFDTDNLVWTATYTANDDFDGTGSVTLTAGSYADAVGNVGSGGADTVTIDTENPEAIVALVADNLSDGTNSTDLTITFSESPVGFVPGDDLSVSGGVLGTGGFDTDNLVWTATYTANDDFDGTGSVTLTAGTYVDAAGNAGSGDSDSVTIETENPEATVALVADNLSDGTNSTDLTITFSESPAGFVPGDDLSVSGGVLGTGSFDADNLVWTASYTANDDFDGAGSVTLAAGSYADAVGNVGSGGADTVTIDTENPEAIVALTADSLSDASNSTDLTITFSESPNGFDPNDDLTVTGGVLSGGGFDGANLVWTATYTADDGLDTTGSVSLASSSYTDAVGNFGSGDSDTVVINTVNPVAVVEFPAVTLSDSANSTSVTITFSAVPLGFVAGDDLTVANGSLGTGSFDTDNLVWTATYTANDDFDGSGSVEIAAGSYTDAAGNAGGGDADTVDIDTTNPTATVTVADDDLIAGETSAVTILFSELVVGFSNDDLLVANGTLSDVSSTDQITWTATFTPNADVEAAGNVIELDLSGVSDAVGNSGSGTVDSNAYVIDTLVPVVTVEALTTNDTTPGLSGEVDDANATLSLTVAGQTVAAVNNGNGTWTLADDVLNALTEGVYDVAVSATDAAGNIGVDTTTNELVIGVQPPVVTVDSLVTNDSTPALTGTVDDSGATISVTVDGQTFAATNNQDGTWLLANDALSALSDGVYDVSVTATDVIGNVGSDGTTNELVVDTVSPVVGVNALLTNDTTPELTGTVDDTIAIVVIVVEGQNVSAVNSGDGTWTVADGVLTSLAEGVYDVQVTAVDAAGNIGSDVTTNELEIDVSAPTVSVDSLATNDVTPTLTGSVNDNSAVVTVSVGGQSGQALNNQDGSWSFEVPVGLSDGVYDVSVTAVDASSNSVNDSTTNELTIDTTAPVVGIDSLITNDTTPGLMGTVDDSGASVLVTVDGQTLAATNNGDGTWSLADNALSALAEGTFDVVVLAEDAVGNQGSDGTSGELVVDLTSPLVAVNSLSTNDSRPALSGTIDDASADVSLTVDGQVRSAVNNGDGTWTLADDSLSTLSDGVYDVSVTATDAAGNVGSDSTSDELVIDATAPVVTVDSLTTEDPSPALSGTVDDPAASISLVVGGQSRVGVNQGDGTWTLADDSLLPFPDGTYDVVVSATDSFGNVGQDATVDELVIDTSTRFDFGTSSSPVASGHIAVTGSPYSSSSGFGWESGSIGVRDRGSSSSDLSRDFNFTAGTGTFVVDVANGTYDVTLTMGDASFAQGPWDLYLEGAFQATQSTSAGDSQESTYQVEVSDGQLTVLFDTSNNAAIQGLAIRDVPDGTAPVVGVDSLVTNDATPALTGTVDDAFASVAVTVNGETLDAVNNGDGTWLLADNQLTALTEGVYDVQVEATDVVGNVGSDTTSDELEIDLTVPVVSVASLVTSDSTPGLSGTVDDASATVTVTVDGQVVSAVNNGNGTWAVADNILSVLSDGVYDVLVTAEDVAGNVGQDSTDSELTIDSTAPLVTVDSLVTNDSTPALTGTVDDSGATISVTVDGQTFAATNNQNGTWLLADNALSALSDGVYDVSVTATDVIGNVGSDGTTNELVIDTVSPVVGVNAVLTNDTTPELTGTIDDTLASVTVVVDGQAVSAANNGDGTWTVADGVLTSLAEGVYDVQVTAVDLAGNVGSDGTTNELDIDLGALVVSVDSLATNDVTPTLTGSVNDNSAVVTVSVGGQSGQAVNNQDGSWSFEVPIGLSEGIYDVSASAVDASSNNANDSTTNELTIDTTAPVVGIDSLITNDTTPGLMGTVDDSGASVLVTVDGQTLAATNNGDGTWSLADNALSALAEGTFDVVVLAEDAVGNQGSDGTSGELVVDLTSPLVAVNSLSTNDSRPALSGTIDDASADVSLTVDGQVRSAVNNGDGTWTLADDSLSTLSDGVYDVAVTATDVAGNVGSDSTSDELVINTIAPVVTVDSLTTEDSSPALSGTVDDPAALISLVIGGQSRVGVNQGDGTWTLADDSLLPFPDGTYDVVVSATDSFGNVGQDATVDELVIDTSTRFDFGTSSSPVASGHIAVTGFPYNSSSGFGWESGSIGVRDRGSSSSDLSRDFNFTSGTGAFVVDVANGTYDVTLTMGDASFAQGPWDLYLEGAFQATQSTNAGDSQESTYQVEVSDGQLTVLFETSNNAAIQGLVIRELPDGTAPVVGVDSLVTNDATPALTGTVDDAFASVAVTVNGETLDAVNNGDGTWLLADNQLTALTEGVYDVQVEATDVVGNVGSDTTSDELEIDLTVPVVSVASLVTSDSTPGLSGTVDDASATVTVTVDGQVVSAVNNGNGTWAVADNILSVLSDGVYDVLVTAEDVAGNVGQDSTDSELTIDSTAPLVTVDSLVTNDSTPALTGTVDDSGATISVTVDGQTFAATNNQNGTWLLADNALSALSDGVYDVSVTATDVIGNVGSDGTTNELVIDTVSPVVGVNAVLTNDTTPELTGTIDDTLASVTVVVDGQAVSAANNGDGTWTVADGVLTSLAEGVYDVQVTAVDLAGNVGSDGTTNELDIDLGALVVSVDSLATNDVTPTLTGSVNDNSAVVTVSVGGQSGQAVNNQDGSWSFEVPVGLSEGIYDVSASAVDASSNNANDSTTNELTIDTTAPVVGIDSLITNDTTPGLTGTVDDSGASVLVTVDGQTLAATNNGDGTWSLADNALSALAEGTFDVVVLAEDAVGNQGSDGTSGELVVDLTSPLVAVNSLSTNDSRPALSGTIDDASADVSLTVDGQVRSAVNNGDGTWTLADDSLSTLSDGVYDVSATATDAAGNVGSDSTSDELVIDATAPVVTVDSLTTEDPSPALSGTVDDPAASISLVVGGQSRVGVNQGDGTWTLADDSLLPFPDGTYDVVVSATDSFGNVGQDATVDELVIDTSTRFDFGTSSSPVASGHIAVTGSPYSSSSGFGWESGSIGVRDRGSSSSDLSRDFNFTAGTGTFVVDVANGTYDVTLTMGDASFAQGPWDLYLEGAFQATQSTSAGDSQESTYQVEVSDGQLTVLFDTSNNAAIQGLRIASAGASVLLSAGSGKIVEGGATDSYSLALSQLPTGDVGITVASDAQSEVSVDGVNFSSAVTVTFDETNGKTPQEITVRAVDDTAVEGTHISTITHAIASTEDSVNFPTSLDIDDLVLTVLDNESINFIANYQDSAGEGFFDASLGQQRRDAMEAALDAWENSMLASYAGETIYVDAKMDPLSSGVLGGASSLSFWNVAGVGGAGAALANHLAEEDLNENESEIRITLNSSITSWYYGTDAATPTSKWDFMTVVIHEVGHGLNYFSGIQTDGSNGWGSGDWGIYESFLELGDGTSLTTMATDAERAAAIISDDVYWGGANATAANSDNRVRIYAPNPYEPGSSVSHVNQATYAGVAVMTPALLNGVAIHTPNAFELGMMKDMGWTLGGSGGSSSRAGGQGGNSATAGSFNGDDAGHNMRVADSGQTDAMEAGFGDSGLRSIWDDESILHPISKDLNPALVLAAETEKALVGGFDQSEDSNDDFFELLGKIDSQRQSESSDLAGLEKDSLATLNQRDELAQRRARKS